MLTPEQLAAWRKDGFLVVDGFVSAAACDELMARTAEMVDAFDPAGVASVFSTTDQVRTTDEYFLESGDKIRFFFEESAFDDSGPLRQPKALALNKLGHAMHDLDPVFDRFSRTPALAEVAAEIGFVDPGILQSMYIFKPPRIGGEVVSHTDHTFLWTDPPSVTGFWFTLEDATVENGCMWALPGGHTIPVKSRFHRTGAAGDGTAFEVFDDAPYPEDGMVPLEAPQGTLVLLHGALPHRSGANASDRSRHAYTLHAVERGAAYPPDSWLRRPPSMPLRGFTSAV